MITIKYCHIGVPSQSESKVCAVKDFIKIAGRETRDPEDLGRVVEENGEALSGFAGDFAVDKEIGEAGGGWEAERLEGIAVLPLADGERPAFAQGLRVQPRFGLRVDAGAEGLAGWRVRWRGPFCGDSAQIGPVEGKGNTVMMLFDLRGGIEGGIQAVDLACGYLKGFLPCAERERLISFGCLPEEGKRTAGEAGEHALPFQPTEEDAAADGGGGGITKLVPVEGLAIGDEILTG